MLCGNFREEINNELDLNDSVMNVAQIIKTVDSGDRLNLAKEKIMEV